MIESMLLQYGGYSGMGYGMMGGGWWFIGWIFMILFWVAVILAIIWLYRQVRGEEKAPAAETPQDILKRRYASGEITKEEYSEMKKEIRG